MSFFGRGLGVNSSLFYLQMLVRVHGLGVNSSLFYLKMLVRVHGLGMNSSLFYLQMLVRVHGLGAVHEKFVPKLPDIPAKAAAKAATGGIGQRQ